MFENSLIESSHRKGDSRKAMTLPVSMALHAIVIGAALGASIWFVEDVPGASHPGHLLRLRTAPAASPAVRRPKAAPQPKQVVPKVIPVQPTEMTAPTMIPDKIPEALTAPEPEAPLGSRGRRRRGRRGRRSGRRSGRRGRRDRAGNRR